MRLTRRQLRRLIIETITNEDIDVGECLDPSAPPWQDFLKKLKAVNIPYEEIDLNDQLLTVAISYEDIMRITTPSGLRAIFAQHHKKHPSYVLICDFYPRNNMWTLMGEEGWGKPSKNDIVVTLADINALESDLGIEVIAENWYYIDADMMNKIPPAGC